MSSQNSTRADALVPAVILFGGMTLLLVGLLASRPNVAPAKSTEVASSAVESSPEATAIVAETTAVVAEATEAAQAVAVALDPAKVKAGETSFQTTCSACHGFNAMGIPGLGKPLIGSKFVDGLTDDQLVEFLKVGRSVTDPLNTTGVMMPPRGGNPTLTDDKLAEVVAYIRSLNQGANQTAAGASPTAAPTSSTPAATSAPFTQLDTSGLTVPTALSGGDNTTSGAQNTPAPTEVSAVPTTNAGTSAEATAAPTEGEAYLTVGKTLYNQSCAGCHGADGSGVQNMAKPLGESTLLQSKNGIGLLDFLIDGDPAMNPPHPYRGGTPELSNDDLLSIIGYLYSLPTGK